jgi:hypothetical protein
MSKHERLQACVLFALSLCAALAMPAPVSAQESGGDSAAAPAATAQDLPAATTIIQRYIEASGGVEAIEGQKARRATGTIEAPAQGIRGDVETLAAPPDKLRLKIVIPGLGEIRSGYDGTTGWLIHPAFGPMVVEGRMLQQTQQQADMRSMLHPGRFVKRMETVERTEFDGRDCYKVKVVTQWDEEYFEFFEVDSGLLAGSIRKLASPMGELESTTTVGDYEEVDGVLLPTRVVQTTMGMEQVVKINQIETVEPGPDAFALPAEIRALVAGTEGSPGGGR